MKKDKNEQNDFNLNHSSLSPPLLTQREDFRSFNRIHSKVGKFQLHFFTEENRTDQGAVGKTSVNELIDRFVNG